MADKSLTFQEIAAAMLRLEQMVDELARQMDLPDYGKIPPERMEQVESLRFAVDSFRGRLSLEIKQLDAHYERIRKTVVADAKRRDDV